MTLVIVAVAAFVMYQITNMLVVTVTPSVEHRVFYKSDESARKGDYVTFMLKPMKSFVYDGVIPVGKAFVYGGNKDSFDSRYWGFIDLSTAQRLLPLI